MVDGSRALDGLLLSCLELSESIFVVLTQEFPAVRNAQHYLSALARAGYGHEAVKLVVNRHEKRGCALRQPGSAEADAGRVALLGAAEQVRRGDAGGARSAPCGDARERGAGPLVSRLRQEAGI